jgi:16S rRNA (guanine527-N7)-methyltransferase
VTAGVFDRPALQQALQAGIDELGLKLSSAGLERLLDYTALLHKWNRVYNLTAVRDPARMVTQHLLDSLAAVPAISHARKLLDVGAGGGLPAMVFAIWAQDNGLAMQISMVDTVAKKTAFLTQAKAELGLENVTVLTGRVEKLVNHQAYDVITSRAFAELADFVDLAGHLLDQGGNFIALKGVDPAEEIDRLPPGWQASKVESLRVPGLDAQRHLVWITRREVQP